jgi:hypothetical protein
VEVPEWAATYYGKFSFFSLGLPSQNCLLLLNLLNTICLYLFLELLTNESCSNLKVLQLFLDEVRDIQKLSPSDTVHKLPSYGTGFYSYGPRVPNFCQSAHNAHFSFCVL